MESEKQGHTAAKFNIPPSISAELTATTIPAICALFGAEVCAKAVCPKSPNAAALIIRRPHFDLSYNTFQIILTSEILHNYYHVVILIELEDIMKTKILAVVLLASMASLPGVASAKGCLKGAAAGGVGGHMLGEHGTAGAAAGCAVGHHKASKHAAESNTASANTTPASTAPATPAPATPK
jgi:hypothetical protein